MNNMQVFLPYIYTVDAVNNYFNKRGVTVGEWGRQLCIPSLPMVVYRVKLSGCQSRRASIVTPTPTPTPLN